MTFLKTRIRQGVWAVVTALLLLACGEDRTHEYEEKTALDHWMLEAMQATYLWGDSIKTEKIAWKDYFAAPSTFFSKLIGNAPIKDQWSWCEIDTLKEDHHQRGHFNHLDSYGLDFMLMQDPTGATNRQYARVLTVYPNSPAERCGLERGDFIGMVDGNRMTSSQTSALENGRGRTIVRSRFGVNEETQEFYWLQTDTLTMERSTRVADAAFPLCKKVVSDGSSVAYLQCNSLNASLDELMGLARQIDAMQTKTLVLDLRLCNEGTLESARLLASFLIDESYSDETFAKTIFRESRSSDNRTYGFEPQAVANNLSVTRLYVITSSYTSGPAEWLIRSLQALDETGFVTTVGTKSAGQVVLTESVEGKGYFVTIHPAVAFVADRLGNYEYEDGIAPDIEVNEFEYAYLYPYGDARETVLLTILSIIPE